MLTLERYLESDKGICSPVTGLIHSLGAQGAQGLAVEAERAFLRAATARRPGPQPCCHVCLLRARRVRPPLFFEFPPRAMVKG